ncbi:MAG: recombination mediator RecR [Pseudomonadales bacterium]|nr:recombination mediator RecR [Pseudomonadales bacterium]
MAKLIIDELIDALRCLPGVGPKSAQRMVMHLLERDRNGARQLADKLVTTMDKIRHCAQCRNFTDLEICQMCSSPARDGQSLCVVENPADLIAIEQTGQFRGKYFVLMGTLSPIDGIGPDEIGIDILAARCVDEVKEVILAIGSSVEGEATAHYIAEMIKPRGIEVSRIAQGIPMGGELEYIDAGTLSHALTGRKVI